MTNGQVDPAPTGTGGDQNQDSTVDTAVPAPAPPGGGPPERQRSPKDPPSRISGDQETRYKGHSRWQIIIEYGYLLATLLLALLGLLYIASHTFAAPGCSPATLSLFGMCLSSPPLLISMMLFFSGMVGGTVFSLKWLYHSVAKEIWFKDRLWWRLSIPWMGGSLGVFASFVFAKTLGTTFDQAALNPQNLLPACGLSFLVGVFADGVLASLEKLARKIFGTLNDFGA